MSKLIIECESWVDASKLHIKHFTNINKGVETLRLETMHKIINFEEEAVKAALIKVGWTPPIIADHKEDKGKENA